MRALPPFHLPLHSMYYYIHSPEGSVDIYYRHISICPMITCYTVYMIITLNIYYYIFLPIYIYCPHYGTHPWFVPYWDLRQSQSTSLVLLLPLLLFFRSFAC